MYIASPTRLHAAHVQIAATSKKHIIVEKPLAATIQECDAISNAVRQNDIVLLCGHTHGFDPAIEMMANLVRSGQLGDVQLVHSFNYTDFVYRARSLDELDVEQGGGVLLLQAPHQIDMVKELLDCEIASVYGRIVSCDPERTNEGGYVALLDSVKCSTATLTYSGYGYFDSAQFNGWRGERGQYRDPDTHLETWRAYRERTAGGERSGRMRDRLEDGSRKKRMYGSDSEGASLPAHEGQPTFGTTIVTCERGDIRQAGDILVLDTAEGRHVIGLENIERAEFRVINEFRQAVAAGAQPLHNADWATRTVEACLAIRESAQKGDRVMLGGRQSLRLWE